jgi:TPR repeat protein
MWCPKLKIGFVSSLNYYDAAFEEWQPLAKQGNADAQNNLGTMYANGKGVLKDAKQAASWYQKAAEGSKIM